MSDSDQDRAEEQVRQLLAGVRHEEPMPADVVDRLDRVLADLTGESRRTPAPVDLAARRRRRVARNLLAAAAAVVVLGVGVSQVDLSTQESDDAGGATSADAPESSALESDAGADNEVAPPYERPLVLHSDEFDRQVRRLRALDAAPESLADADTDGLSARASGWCDTPAWGRGDRVRVRYDGKRGVLVLRTPADGSRAVDLYLCGDTVPTRSTTVPVG